MIIILCHEHTAYISNSSVGQNVPKIPNLVHREPGKLCQLACSSGRLPVTIGQGPSQLLAQCKIMPSVQIPVWGDGNKPQLAADKKTTEQKIWTFNIVRISLCFEATHELLPTFPVQNRIFLCIAQGGEYYAVSSFPHSNERKCGRMARNRQKLYFQKANIKFISGSQIPDAVRVHSAQTLKPLHPGIFQWIMPLKHGNRCTSYCTKEPTSVPGIARHTEQQQAECTSTEIVQYCREVWNIAENCKSIADCMVPPIQHHCNKGISRH